MVVSQRPDLRASVSSVTELVQVRTLLAIYEGALAEARSWDDRALHRLIASLELLQERARARERELSEEEGVGALLSAPRAEDHVAV